MPNYFVTNTARFNPFSYQELATPLIQATQQHLALDEALSSIDDGTLATYLAGEDPNSEYVKGYNSLTQRIKDLSEQLASNGLNANIMRNALKLKGDYKKFSTPVETAGKRRYQLMDEYRKLSASNPYLIGEDPGQKSLDFYINNPNYNPEYDNGEAYIKQGTLIGSQLADQLRNPDAPYTVVPGSGGAFLRAVYRRGYTPEEIANDQMFVNITNQIMQSRGIDPSSNDARTNAIRSYIQQGLFASLGKDDIDMRNNPNFLNPLQQLQYEKTKRELNTPTDGDERGNFSTRYRDYNFVGSDRAWANKILGTQSSNGILRDLRGLNITDKSGTPFNSTLDVYYYLQGLKNQVVNTSTYSPYSQSSAAFEKAKAQYKEESERLKNYTISNSNYNDIKKTLDLNDVFTYDDVTNHIASDSKRFSSGVVPAFSVVSVYDSKENFDRFMGNLEENIGKLDDTKGYFYSTTNGVTLDKALSAKEVKSKLFGPDKKALRISATAPLMNSDSGSYVIVNTSDNYDIAVPIGLFNNATDVYNYISNPIVDILSNDKDFIKANEDLDIATRVATSANMEPKQFEYSSSKGRR